MIVGLHDAERDHMETYYGNPAGIPDHAENRTGL